MIYEIAMSHIYIYINDSEIILRNDQPEFKSKSV